MVNKKNKTKIIIGITVFLSLLMTFALCFESIKAGIVEINTELDFPDDTKVTRLQINNGSLCALAEFDANDYLLFINEVEEYYRSEIVTDDDTRLIPIRKLIESCDWWIERDKESDTIYLLTQDGKNGSFHLKQTWLLVSREDEVVSVYIYVIE